ncbi:MAG: hypothetical protein RLZZ59_795, partial [Pseudomonadota bacterium]
IIKLVLLDLVLLLILSVFVVRKIFKKLIYKNRDNVGGRLRRRVIIMFSLVAAIPTIVISIFSTYFFNFGLQSWFNQRVGGIMSYSVNLSQAYSSEFSGQLKHSALAMADDLSDMYYDLVHAPVLFNKVLNAQAEMRSLDEAIVFQNNNRTLLAQTSMSFSLAFSTIPAHLISRADTGEVVEINQDKTRVRILIKLKEYNDTYLLVGKMIDPQLVDYATKISLAVDDYERLNSQLSGLQIQFSIAFIAVALLLLIIAISGGMIFAGQIITPIRRLLIATEKLHGGDLLVKVEEKGHKDDELLILSRAFNKMVERLDEQQKELILAQRALAWSDVARMVAHEIKNPLTPIQLASTRILQKFGEEVADKNSLKQYINTILKHTSDIGNILGEFVNFAKMPAPKMKSRELVGLVKEFVESRRLLNDKIEYNFVTDLESANFECDPTQLSQVLINLFKNAEDSIEDAKRDGIINTSISREDDNIVLKVSDNGSGFPLDAIGKATEPYFTTRAKGTGLGLAIVQKIIADHNGTMKITNNSNVGAEIKIIFVPNKKKIG